MTTQAIAFIRTPNGQKLYVSRIEHENDGTQVTVRLLPSGTCTFDLKRIRKD